MEADDVATPRAADPDGAAAAAAAERHLADRRSLTNMVPRDAGPGRSGSWLPWRRN